MGYGKVTAITMEEQSHPWNVSHWMIASNTSIFLGNGCGIYVYNPAKHCWIEYSSETQRYNYPSCIIGQKIITLGRKISNIVKLRSIEAKQNVDIDYNIANTLFPGPRGSILNYAITNISDDKVIVAGGYRFNSRFSSNVYEGTLSTDGRDVIWKKLPPMNQSRSKHVAFNLYDSLYVIGGITDSGLQTVRLTSCEIYSIYTETWTVGPELPCELDKLFATTNTMKTFAIICGWTITEKKMHILILDKDDGFKTFPGVRCDPTLFASIAPIPECISRD